MKKFFKLFWVAMLIGDIGFVMKHFADQPHGLRFINVIAIIINLVCLYIAYDMLRPYHKRDEPLKRHLIRTTTFFSTAALWIYQLFAGVPGADSLIMCFSHGIIVTLFVQSLYKLVEEM